MSDEYRPGICIYSSCVPLRNCGGRQITQKTNFYLMCFKYSLEYLGAALISLNSDKQLKC